MPTIDDSFADVSVKAPQLGRCPAIDTIWSGQPVLAGRFGRAGIALQAGRNERHAMRWIGGPHWHDLPAQPGAGATSYELLEEAASLKAAMDAETDAELSSSKRLLRLTRRH